jgi:hypothetical protein
MGNRFRAKRAAPSIGQGEVGRHMSGSETGAAPPAKRWAWREDLRRADEQQEDALAGGYDAHWGVVEDTHQGFVERFLSKLPPAGRVLASGRALLGVDHASAWLAIAAAKFSQIPSAGSRRGTGRQLARLGHAPFADDHPHGVGESRIGWPRTGAGSGSSDSPHPFGTYGAARPGERLVSTALSRRSLIRMRPLVQVQPGPQNWD